MKNCENNQHEKKIHSILSLQQFFLSIYDLEMSEKIPFIEKEWFDKVL